MTDLERAVDFYSGVLGLPLVRRQPGADGADRAVWLRAGDAVLMLERELHGVDPVEGSAHLLALAVEDLGAWEARLGQLGLALDGRSEHTLYLRDPDGHRVGLSAYRFDFFLD